MDKLDPTRPQDYDDTFRNIIEAAFVLDAPTGLVAPATNEHERAALQRWRDRLVNGELYRWMLKPGSAFRSGTKWPPRFWATRRDQEIIARDGCW